MNNLEAAYPHSYETQIIEHIRAQQPLIRGRPYLLLKRLFDFAFTLVTLPLWLPLIALCAVLIKIESPRGPVFFRQERTGRGGRRFPMYKFRTMVPNAEEMKKELAHLNELQWPDFKITNDPRITRIGRILRKTSLDELPQVINVFLGNMSLVGPRPTSFTPDTYRLWQTERLDVAPGITGLWQLLGRGETEFDDRLRLDIFYIEHRSLYVDFYILIHTFLVVLKQRGAH
jgi:lipopolysaccharide/colanic/teichoic acid biosynthesis glycosyltransferase